MCCGTRTRRSRPVRAVIKVSAPKARKADQRGVSFWISGITASFM